MQNLNQKISFVEKLSDLLRMTKTRTGVDQVALVSEDTLIIIYESGAVKSVNIALDSDIAIIKDVIAKI